MTLGALWCHWPTGTLFRLTGLADGCVCGVDADGCWGVWPLAECAAVEGGANGWQSDKQG